MKLVELLDLLELVEPLVHQPMLVDELHEIVELWSILNLFLADEHLMEDRLQSWVLLVELVDLELDALLGKVEALDVL